MTSVRAWAKVLLMDLQARLRGRRRVAPRFSPNGVVTRGRIYDAPVAKPIAVPSEPLVTITARHFGPDGALKGVHVVRGRAGGKE